MMIHRACFRLMAFEHAGVRRSCRRMAAFVCMLAALLAASAEANAVFPVGNFTVYGAVKTWGSDYFAAKDGVMVMATKTNGTVLATSTLFNPVWCTNPEFGDVRNYQLTIPMATTASEKAAVENESLFLIIVSDTSTYRTVDAGTIVVTGAGEKQLVNLSLATDNDGDGVADQYVAELAVDMYAYGYDTYDKDADWDEDGQSNYQEYLAGTNPFDPDDKLVLTFFSAHSASVMTRPDGYTFPVGFYAKNGRTYTVEGTGSLATNALGRIGWTNETFLVSAATSVSKSYTATADDEPSDGGTTFWLMPVGNQHFWRLIVNMSDAGVKIEKIGEGR